ncbi:hypothetical protein B0T18DRAFT_388904 [Schizothecium vesticola]|uniref:Uncharacterized protein n=1 Tax=Schizothecium vesticola TaxID=314040 RepID=A0AA40K7W9_9PEZI|nr:hypothetical protein B0T18DRAFT_388904 [Schizothecium vesticola]
MEKKKGDHHHDGLMCLAEGSARCALVVQAPPHPQRRPPPSRPPTASHGILPERALGSTLPWWLESAAMGRGVPQFVCGSPNYPGEGAATFDILSRRKLVRVSYTVLIANQEKARRAITNSNCAGALPVQLSLDRVESNRASPTRDEFLLETEGPYAAIHTAEQLLVTLTLLVLPVGRPIPTSTTLLSPVDAASYHGARTRRRCVFGATQGLRDRTAIIEARPAEEASSGQRRVSAKEEQLAAKIPGGPMPGLLYGESTRAEMWKVGDGGGGEVVVAVVLHKHLQSAHLADPLAYLPLAPLPTAPVFTVPPDEKCRAAAGRAPSSNGRTSGARVAVVNGRRGDPGKPCNHILQAWMDMDMDMDMGLRRVAWMVDAKPVQPDVAVAVAAG